MAESLSPLRYPGGKQVLGRVLGHLIRLNGREGGIYVEPYAGGAGAALYLLFGEYVKRVCINDVDPHIYAFWDAAINRTDRFLKLLFDTPLNVDEWRRQRAIYLAPARHSRLRVGFATFYLNRCNRSGVIANGGLIGGINQTGNWKMDARFNRRDLALRIERIARYGDRISLDNSDAQTLLRSRLARRERQNRAFVYLDPPYFNKGRQLYHNHYTPEDHASLARYLEAANYEWVMSYDNAPMIRRLYSSLLQVRFNVGYSAREARTACELLIVPPHVAFPEAWHKRIPSKFISAADRIRATMPTAVISADRKKVGPGSADRKKVGPGSADRKKVRTGGVRKRRRH